MTTSTSPISTSPLTSLTSLQILSSYNVAQILINYNLSTGYKTFHASRMTSDKHEIMYKILQYMGWTGISLSHSHKHLCALAPFLQGEEKYCASCCHLDNTNLPILQNLAA